MKFAQIEMLFFIWAVPLLLLVMVIGYKRRRRILAGYCSTKTKPSIVIGVSRNKRWIRSGLMLVSLVFLAIALSGPQYGYRWQKVEQKGIDIIIALDCSRSMLATDIKPTRLDRAKREIYDLLAMFKGDRAGLVAFSGTAFLQCPLTLDYEAFNLFLKTLTPDFLPVGGSDIAQAMDAAMSGFDEKTDSEKAVILITDGENTGDQNPIARAQAARDQNIKIFCIGVGGADGVPVPDKGGGFKKDSTGKIVLTRLDEDLLKKIAGLTQGTYVRSVAGDMDLDAIYTKEIRRKMETTTLASGKKRIWEDRYQWALILAIVALAAEMLLPSTRMPLAVIVLTVMLVYPAHPAFADAGREGLRAYRSGNYEKALKLLIDAQLENPDQPEILYNIGNAYYKTGNYKAAIDHYGQVVKSENEALKEKAYYNLGNSNYRLGKYENAIKDYQAALKLKPDDVDAKENLEFVKKIIEQKKNQPGDNKDGEPPDNQNQTDEKEKQSKSGTPSQKQQADNDTEKSADSKRQQGEKDSQRESGSQMTKHSKNNQKDDTTGGKKSDQKEKTTENTSAQPAYGAESDETLKDKRQVRQILNRLKDQPGRAMIPEYRKEHVEKDW